MSGGVHPNVGVPGDVLGNDAGDEGMSMAPSREPLGIELSEAVDRVREQLLAARDRAEGPPRPTRSGTRRTPQRC